jgi:hypothetical protein
VVTNSNDVDSVVKLLKVHSDPRSVVDKLKNNETFEQLFVNNTRTPWYDIIDYARLRGERWREGEKWIMRYDAMQAGYEYARDVIKGRWPDLENLLLSVVKGDRANRPLMQGVTTSVDYSIFVIRDRWDDFEEAVIASYSTQSYTKFFSPLVYYHYKFFDEPWDELTDIMRDRMVLHKMNGFRSAEDDIREIELYLENISMNVSEFVDPIPKVHQADISIELKERGLR